MDVSTAHILASAEASRAMLPPDCRVHQALRDYSILSVALPHGASQHVAIVWDQDRDFRAYLLLGALISLNREACANLVGIAESKGRVQSFWAATAPLGNLPTTEPPEMTLLQTAAEKALWPHDVWTALPPEFVQLSANGTLDVSALSDGHPLKVVPARHPIGRVGRVRSGR